MSDALIATPIALAALAALAVGIRNARALGKIQKQVTAIAKAPRANTGGPRFPPPSFPPRTPTRESEAKTPSETPRSKTRSGV